jgi:hypothetical protein
MSVMSQGPSPINMSNLAMDPNIYYPSIEPIDGPLSASQVSFATFLPFPLLMRPRGKSYRTRTVQAY